MRYLTKDGASLEPQRGKTYETGLKGSWFDGRLNASASVFMNKRDHLGVYAGRLPNGEEYYRSADKTGIGGGIFQSLTRNLLGSPDIISFDAGAHTAVTL